MDHLFFSIGCALGFTGVALGAFGDAAGVQLLGMPDSISTSACDANRLF
jgi:hypothetical protein